MNNREHHILVVDDDRRLRDLLRKYLSDHGYMVTTAGDVAAARAQMAGLRFDLMVLDVMMPGESGLDYARSLRNAGHDLPILMLTARGEADERIEGLEAGVDDYLPKPFEPKELLLRIASILRRAAVRGRDSAVRFGAMRFDLQSGRLERDGAVIRLTAREIAMLQILARKAGRTVSRAELSAGDDDGMGRAVDVQITRLRRKIEDDPKMPRYLQTVRGEGYVLWVDG